MAATKRTKKKTMSETLIDSIREEMATSGVSVKELAEASGVTDQYLYRVFRGEQTPSIDVVDRILRSLNCSIIVVRH